MSIVTLRNFALKGLATSAIAILSAGTINHAAAQTMNYGSLATMFGEPVTTSATGSPQKASDAPVPMEIITAEDIKRSGVTNIAEIVSRVAGVNLQRESVGDAEIGVRGYTSPTSNRLLVLVNGRQVYLDFFGFTDWTALPVRLEEIQQIEVIKGPNTALFGFNAAAGVINIITFNPAYDNNTAATVRTGARNAESVSGAASYHFGTTSGVRLSGGFDEEHEYKGGPNQPPVPVAPKLNRNTPSAYSLAGEGVFSLTESTQLRTEATTTFHDYNVLNPGLFATLQLQFRTQSYKAELVSTTPIGLVSVQLYDNETNGDFQATIPLRSNLTVGKAQDIFKLGANTTIRATAEWRKNSIEVQPDYSGSVKYDVYSGSLMAEHKFADSVTFTGAMRYDDLKLSRTSPVPLGIPQTASLWDRSIDKLSYNFGLVTQVNDSNSARLSTSRGLLLPSLFDMSLLINAVPLPAPIYTAAVIIGNPRLNATVVTNYEAGWDWTISDHAKLGVSAFYQANDNIFEITDDNVLPPDQLIPRSGGLPPILVGTSVLLGNSEVNGFEATFKGDLGGNWRYGANAALLNVTDHFSGLYLRRVAPQKTTPQVEGNANLGWSNGKWTIDGYLKYVGRSDNFVNSSIANVQGVTVPALFTVPSYENLDLRIAYRLGSGLTLAFEGTNLLDNNAVRNGGNLIPTEVRAALRADF